MIEKTKSIIQSIGLIAVAGVLITIANAVTIVVSVDNKEVVNLFLYVLAIAVGMVIIPYFYTRYIILEDEMPICKFDMRHALFDVLIILALSVIAGLRLDFFHNLTVAIGEEFLFRYIILIILSKNYSKKDSYLIGAIVFAALLHINGDLVINIITKFPAGMILYYIYEKYGIQDAIAIHWAYNSAISYFLQ